VTFQPPYQRSSEPTNPPADRGTNVHANAYQPPCQPQFSNPPYPLSVGSALARAFHPASQTAALALRSFAKPSRDLGKATSRPPAVRPPDLFARGCQLQPRSVEAVHAHTRARTCISAALLSDACKSWKNFVITIAAITHPGERHLIRTQKDERSTSPQFQWLTGEISRAASGREAHGKHDTKLSWSITAITRPGEMPAIAGDLPENRDGARFGSTGVGSKSQPRHQIEFAILFRAGPENSVAPSQRVWRPAGRSRIRCGGLLAQQQGRTESRCMTLPRALAG
jgi:hypothetical protein